MFGFWLHLASLTVYFGSLIGLWAIVLPILAEMSDQKSRATFLARILKLYNPWQVGSLGVVILSGAIQLTDLKAAHREFLIRDLGGILGLKLTMSFVLVIISTYQAMGIGHRFVKRYEAHEAVSSVEVESVARRLRVSTLSILLLAVLTAYVGIHLRG